MLRDSTMAKLLFDLPDIFLESSQTDFRNWAEFPLDIVT